MTRLALALLLVIGGLQAAPPVATVKPFRATEALPMDPDDPAIWVNRRAVSARSARRSTSSTSKGLAR